jgi:hypothetical protein
MNVLTSMTTLLATTEASAMMFNPRPTFKIMYPGPARCSAERMAILNRESVLKLLDILEMIEIGV